MFGERIFYYPKNLYFSPYARDEDNFIGAYPVIEKNIYTNHIHYAYYKSEIFFKNNIYSINRPSWLSPQTLAYEFSKRMYNFHDADILSSICPEWYISEGDFDVERYISKKILTEVTNLINIAYGDKVFYYAIEHELKGTRCIYNQHNSQYYDLGILEESLIYLNEHISDFKEFIYRGYYVLLCKYCDKEYRVFLDDNHRHYTFYNKCNSIICKLAYDINRIEQSLTANLTSPQRRRMEAQLWELRRKKEQEELREAKARYKEVRMYLHSLKNPQGACRLQHRESAQV